MLVPSFGKIIDPKHTVLQGDILSSFFSNIYLHELDIYIINSLKLLNSYKGFPYSQKYTKTAHISLNKKTIITLNLTSTNKFSTVFKLIKYVRYADDFLVGLTCSQKEIKIFLSCLNIFLKK
jgi:hypothetical protein